MRVVAEGAYHGLCLVLGRLLRAGRYASVRVDAEGGTGSVRKRRHAHAPLLVWLGGPLVRLLGTGMRVLPQRAWEERERRVHARLRGTTVRVERGGVLVLPFLRGATLAALLEDPALDATARARAIALASAALAELHRHGLTHADAMAENVMVDLEADVAHWFDFETEHDPRRPLAWRRADDVRALLATCLVRVEADRVAATLALVLDAHADEEVTRALATSVAPTLRRPLAFHLGQAGLSYARAAEMARLLRARVGG